MPNFVAEAKQIIQGTWGTFGWKITTEKKTSDGVHLVLQNKDIEGTKLIMDVGASDGHSYVDFTVDSKFGADASMKTDVYEKKGQTTIKYEGSIADDDFDMKMVIDSKGKLKAFDGGGQVGDFKIDFSLKGGQKVEVRAEDDGEVEKFTFSLDGFVQSGEKADLSDIMGSASALQSQIQSELLKDRHLEVEYFHQDDVFLM